MQNYETVDEDMNEAQIKERGGQMLELYNRPKKSFEVKALLDLSVRAGRALYIGCLLYTSRGSSIEVLK